MPFDNTNCSDLELSTSPVVKLLKQGRKRIARKWCQHYLAEWYGFGGVCAMGALYPLQYHLPFPTIGDKKVLIRNRAISYLKDAIGPYTIISDWNDKPERTQEEVVAAYDRAIKLAQIGELR